MSLVKAVAAVTTLVAVAAATCTIHENVDYVGNTIGKPTTTSSYGQVSGSPPEIGAILLAL